MTKPRLTKAQQRVYDFLLADESGDFIEVPYSVTRDARTLYILEDVGLIESEWRPAKLPPGSFTNLYRAKRDV